MKIFTLSLIFFLLTFAAAFPQQKNVLEYVTKEGSKIWIEGTSTLNNFRCRARLVKGFAYLHSTISLEQKLNKDSKSDNDRDDVTLTILSHNLDCGMDAMNQDMYRAMKTGEFPIIKYSLIHAYITENMDSSGWSVLATHGDLTIAGVTKKVDIIVKVMRLKNGDFRLVGDKLLKMSDFEIVPPSHLWGLIKAHNNFSVLFDLIVGLSAK